jgi:hypothetical protein
MNLKKFLEKYFRGWLPEEPKISPRKLGNVRTPILVLTIATLCVSVTLAYSMVFLGGASVPIKPVIPQEIIPVQTASPEPTSSLRTPTPSPSPLISPEPTLMPAPKKQQIEWNHSYSAGLNSEIHSMVPTKDGGYVLAGYAMYLGDPKRFTSDMWLVKTDLLGKVQWMKSYMNLGEAYSVIQTNDGGYALTGGNGLIKTDASGNIEWSQTYSGGGTRCVIQTNDGGYAIAGAIKLGSVNTFWLVKTNSSGEYQWSQTYSGQSDEIAWSLIQTTDGGYALAGGSGHDGLVVKADSLGNAEWTKAFGGTLYSITQTKPSGYAISGNVFGSSGNSFWLAKLDSLGDMQWNQTFYQGTGRAVLQTSDGGYAVVGTSNLIRTDSTGVEQWDLTYTGTAFSISEKNDQTFALAGVNSETLSNGGWLLKTSKVNEIVP